MVVARRRVSVGAAAVAGRPRIGVGDAGLVLAGEFGGPDLAMMTRALTLPAGRRPALMVIDLRHLSVVVAPHARSDETRLALTGDLDLATAPMLAWALSFALYRQPSRIAVDLRRLETIDARCAHALAGASSRMGDWGGTLVAFGPQPAVRRVLQLCDLEDLIHRGADSPHVHILQEAGA